MGFPAVRVGDMHICPMVTPGVPPIPHVGGPVTGPGVPTVLIGGQPAAVMGDMCTCVGPPDTIIMGSNTVLIGGRPAARMMPGCTTHPGATFIGFPTVLIGDGGGGAGGASPASTSAILTDIEHTLGREIAAKVAQNAALQQAAANGSAFCEICQH